MCVVDVYVDRYPNGDEDVYEHINFCQSGRPCAFMERRRHEPRRIQYNELSTEAIFRRNYASPETPPRTPAGSPLRRSNSRSQRQTSYIPTTERRRRTSEIISDNGGIRIEVINSGSGRRRPRERTERIVMADSLPSPQPSPRLAQAGWTPSQRNSYTSDWERRTPSPRPPRSPSYIVDASPRGRPTVSFDNTPIVIDERRREERPRAERRERSSSVEAVVGPRVVETSSRARRRSRSPRTAMRASSRRSGSVSQAERDHNDEILRRPTVPRRMPPVVINQSDDLQERLSNLDISGRAARERYEYETAAYRRGSERDQQAMNDRLRDRQTPRDPVYRVSYSRNTDGSARIITTADGVRRWA